MKTQANQILLFTSDEYDKSIIGMVKTTKSFDISEQDQLYKKTLTEEKRKELEMAFGGDWYACSILQGFIEYLEDNGLAERVIAPLEINYTDDAEKIIAINEI